MMKGPQGNGCVRFYVHTTIQMQLAVYGVTCRATEAIRNTGNA